MHESSFSLFHHSAPPKTGGDEKAPLLLLLHGYGANEDDLFGLAPYVDERFLVISARAPVRLGLGMHAWFRLGFTPEGILIDPHEVEQARTILRRFLDELLAAYPVDTNAIYLLGFSQGAMMGLDLALREPELIAGVAALSGRIMPSSLETLAEPDRLIGLPVFVAHGTEDNILPISHGRATRERLGELPVSLTYREYEMGHTISGDSLREVADWLKMQLSQQTIH
ncbi:MAG: alpha/beta fold hydrolase [Acidobacteria bacterium]|nr:alpha/beta fold hydrolase [Acidobacteriota bacterium]MBI3422746.1 alpha/beta fold hydrolase [Acidobacteriota bacterium]